MLKQLPNEPFLLEYIGMDGHSVSTSSTTFVKERLIGRDATSVPKLLEEKGGCLPALRAGVQQQLRALS